MLPGAPLVHENHGTNVVNTHKVWRGDVEAGFRQADFVIEEKFQTQIIEHAYMETEAAVCVPRSTDGVIEVYGSMQHPFSTRRFVAACLGTALSEVEVIGTPMGGGFGGKDDTAAIVCARTALAAKLLGRPVKMVYRRDWSMRESYKRHPYRVHYKMGVTKTGRITAVQCRIVADGGAYCSVTPWVTWRSTVQCCGPYVVGNVHCDTFGVYTNNVVAGAMRGFGSPQMNFVIEQMVEIAAQRAGISGIEFRRRNMVRQGSVTITGQKLDGHKVAMEQALDTVLREMDYEKKLAKCAHGKGDAGELYGIGLAMSYRGVSLGAEGVDFCAAIINAQADGSIFVEVGVHENGQGAESAMSLLLAEELGRQRVPEREALGAALVSRRFRDLMRRLDALASSPPPRLPRGVQGVPVTQAAPALIGKAQKRVLKLGRIIGPDSPATDLHRLRILFKRLRYACEFFQEAFADPASGTDPLADHLQAMVRFQDCLGEHQDAVVAMDRIQDLVKEMVRRGTLAPERLLDLGGLIQVQREIVRDRHGRLAKLWARFDRSSVRRRPAALGGEAPRSTGMVEASEAVPE